MPLILEAKNIRKSFYHPQPVSILKNISLKIKGGESIAIIGRSGEGKSTLLQILGTLEEPCEGELIIAGEKVTPHNRGRLRNEKIGFVFQSFHLLEDYTALENVLMPARIGRKSIKNGKGAKERALELLHSVGLAERADFNIRLLSGGEKQRVAFARALCNNPMLICADEPTGNLDRINAEILYSQLMQFAKNPAKGLLLVTHDEQLAKLCTHQYELKDGEIIHKSSFLNKLD